MMRGNTIPQKKATMKNADMPDASTARWIRLPVRGRCPNTGLSRGMYYQLMGRGLIKSANLKQPGKLTGVRLVWLQSVLDLIERHVVPATNLSERHVVPATNLSERIL